MVKGDVTLSLYTWCTRIVLSFPCKTWKRRLWTSLLDPDTAAAPKLNIMRVMQWAYSRGCCVCGKGGGGEAQRHTTLECVTRRANKERRKSLFIFTSPLCPVSACAADLFSCQFLPYFRLYIMFTFLSGIFYFFVLTLEVRFVMLTCEIVSILKIFFRFKKSNKLI